jgi:hypothetical protein
MQALEGLTGVQCIADDVVIHGRTKEEHDQRLKAFLQKCSQIGIKLQKDKIEYCTSKILFHGHLLTSDGVKPDPEKIKAIEKMPPPTDAGGVARLNGMINYLSRFLPRLSQIMQPIRKLSHKGIAWEWGSEQENAFAAVKTLITSAPVLAYYDPQQPLMVQCDSSQDGIGAVLLQNEKPIDFRSRSMTETERRYAQIEKEMLAVVFSLEKFHQYTFGRRTVIQTDHKPLISIVNKPLNKAPKRLQGMIVRLQKYDAVLEYTPGKQMVLADTLSRAPINEQGLKPLVFESVSSVLAEDKERTDRIRERFEEDEEMKQLAEQIADGWPDDKRKVAGVVRPYFKIRDELTTEDGLIFRGERLVVPRAVRSAMINELHRSHLGVNRCVNRAKEIVY